MKALLKIQWEGWVTNLFYAKDKRGGYSRRPLIGTVFFALLIAIGLLSFGFIFFSMFAGMGMAFIGTPLEWLYFAMAGIIIFALNFITTIFTSQKQLFEAEDNEILLSMPIKPQSILLSRIITLAVTDYLFAFLVGIPAILAWILTGGVSPLGLVLFAVALLFLPLFPLALSCGAGWLLSLLTRRMKNKSLFTTVFSLGFFALYMLVVGQLDAVIEGFMTNADKVGNVVSYVFYPFYCLGLGVGGDIGSYLVFLVCMIAPFVLAFWILSRTFISLVTKKYSGKRTKYVVKTEKRRSLSAALLAREFKRLTSSSMYMLNAGCGLLFTLLIAVAAPIIRLNMGDITGMVSADPSLGISPEDMAMEAEMLLGFMGSIGILIVSVSMSMSMFTAPSISLEGKTLWQLASLPISGRDVLMAKLKMHLWLTAPLGLVASLSVGLSFYSGVPMLLVTLLVPQVFNVFAALLGLRLNIAFPRFDFVNEAAVVKQSLSVSLTMIVTMVLDFVYYFLAMLLSGFMPGEVAYLLVALPLAGVCAVLWWDIAHNGNRYLQRLSD